MFSIFVTPYLLLFTLPSFTPFLSIRFHVRKYIYVASPESQQLHVFNLKHDGYLELVQIVNTPGSVQPMVTSPDKKYLFVGIRPENRLLTYRINADDGSLSLCGEISLSSSPTHLSIDRTGDFIFCSAYQAGKLIVIQRVNGLPNSIKNEIAGLDGCHSANVSYENNILLVPALKQDRIYSFHMNTVHQTQIANHYVNTKNGAGPRHMAFHPNKEYAYCINELNDSIDVWKINEASGLISFYSSVNIMPDSFSGICWAADIHITPDGKNLYVSERTANTIVILQVTENGDSLSVIGYQKTENQPRGFALDDDGKFLIVAGQQSHHITLYKINSENGLLDNLSRYPVGTGPMWVTVISHV